MITCNQGFHRKRVKSCYATGTMMPVPKEAIRFQAHLTLPCADMANYPFPWAAGICELGILR